MKLKTTVAEDGLVILDGDISMSGDDQLGGAGAELPAPLRVRVLDQFGDPVEDVDVTFSVAENPGEARVGTMTVAGQTVTINQSANDPVYGNWGGTIVKGSGCPATLPSSVDYTGTIRRTGGATNEFVISIPSVGISNNAIADSPVKARWEPSVGADAAAESCRGSGSCG